MICRISAQGHSSWFAEGFHDGAHLGGGEDTGLGTVAQGDETLAQTRVAVYPVVELLARRAVGRSGAVLGGQFGYAIGLDLECFHTANLRNNSLISKCLGTNYYALSLAFEPSKDDT